MGVGKTSLFLEVYVFDIFFQHLLFHSDFMQIFLQTIFLANIEKCIIQKAEKNDIIRLNQNCSRNNSLKYEKTKVCAYFFRKNFGGIQKFLHQFSIFILQKATFVGLKTHKRKAIERNFGVNICSKTFSRLFLAYYR